uniref:Uncharacterized protein n=1 Tax=Acrobeloides nanus TaxID=290746 RepID=A0A914D311_9BILA
MDYDLTDGTSRKGMDKKLIIISGVIDDNTISQTNYSTSLCSKVNPIGLGTNQTTTTSTSTTPAGTSVSSNTQTPASTVTICPPTPTCPPPTPCSCPTTTCPPQPSCPSTQALQTTTQGRVTSTRNAGSSSFFIGLNDVAKTGTWVWDQPLGNTLTPTSTSIIQASTSSGASTSVTTSVTATTQGGVTSTSMEPTTRTTVPITTTCQASTVPFFIGLNDVANTGTWAWDQPIGKTLTVYQ